MRQLKRCLWAMVFVLLASCAKEEDMTLKLAPGLEGTWELKMKLRNDYWGGPLYWRDAQSDRRVMFTADGKYYEKQNSKSSFTLVGSYEIISENELEIIWAQPDLPQYPSFTLRHSFESGNLLVLENNQSEGVVGEKYLLVD